jgi:hypothetical protein
MRRRPYNSSVWNDLIKVKDLYLAGRFVKIGYGHNTDFGVTLGVGMWL